MPFLSHNHLPPDGHGAFLIQDTDDECHASASDAAAVHHQNHRTRQKALEQDVEVGEEVDFRRDALILHSADEAFDAALPQTARCGFAGDGSELTLATAHDAANKESKCVVRCRA